jgi:hypothetical protein
MQKELALAAPAQQPESPPESSQEREPVHAPGPPVPVADDGSALPPTELSRRVTQLEAEVERLRQIVHHERKLLRKAVLMQLDLEAYDDLD